MLRKFSFLLLFPIFFLSCTSTNSTQDFTFLALNTTCTIRIFNHKKIEQSEIEGIIVKVEELMSSHITNSDISRINELAGIDYFTPDPMTLEVIKKGIEYGSLSNGIFDISIGPLVKLWDINNQSVVPDNVDIENLLPLVNYKNIIIDNNRVMLKEKGMAIDLGGIAKGYSASLVKEFLKKEGVQSALINLGGNIDFVGLKNGDSQWTIGIQHPRKDTGDYIGIVSVGESSFVSSGDYERFFMEDGVRYHHILDSSTGYPYKGDIIGSSILSNSSLNGDALSTITFSMDFDQIMKLRENIDFEGVFVTRNNTIYLTPGLKDIFTLKDESYSIVP